MNRLIKILIVASLMVGAHGVLAFELCETLNTTKDLLACALGNHPDLIRGKGSLEQADSFEDRAGQRPNLEFSGKSVYGKNFGENVAAHEINLVHTFELGGKRSARIEKAVAEKGQVSSEFLKTKEEVFIATLKALYRIRQVHSEIKTLEEALDTFEKIQKQFKIKPRLGPEQEVSLSLFQLAGGDYKIRKAALESEENALERGVEVAIGKEFPHDKEALLPTCRQSWPDFSSHMSGFSSSSMKLAQSELKSARAEMELAKSESWPDLKFGPTLQSQTEGSSQYLTYGVNFTILLPFFQTNGGGRAVAAAGLTRAEKNLELRRRELTQQRKILLNHYQKSAKSLKNSLSPSEIERKHKSVERQFARGVISSSLVIEAHRQIVDFTKSQNDQELNALESLWRLKALEGNLFDEEAGFTLSKEALKIGEPKP